MLRLKNTGWKEVKYSDVKTGDVITNGINLFRVVMDIHVMPKHPDHRVIKERFIHDNTEIYDDWTGTVHGEQLTRILK